MSPCPATAQGIDIESLRQRPRLHIYLLIYIQAGRCGEMLSPGPSLGALVGGGDTHSGSFHVKEREEGRGPRAAF